MKRHLTSLATLDDTSFAHLLQRAEVFAKRLEAGPSIEPSLTHLTVANLFFEPSTRTRASFELAARHLGATVLNLDIARSSAVKGESLADTVRTLHAMGVGIFVVRHAAEGAIAAVADELADSRFAFASAGEGSRDHPTQGLIDALTLKRRFDDCTGLEVAIVGDLNHSRVARSAAQAFTRLGANVRVAGPAALLPEVALPGTRVCKTLDEALDGARVVMMLRVQRERMDHAGAPDEQAYFAEWGLTEARLAAKAPDALVMHPGPFNRGVEIESAVADGPRSLILEQVSLGVPVRMAVLEWLAAGLADG